MFWLTMNVQFSLGPANHSALHLQWPAPLKQPGASVSLVCSRHSHMFLQVPTQILLVEDESKKLTVKEGFRVSRGSGNIF